MAIQRQTAMAVGRNILYDNTAKSATSNISHLCWPSYQRTTQALGGDAVARWSFPIEQFWQAEEWLENRLGWHFIESANGKTAFAGYIHAVRASYNGVMFAASLDEVANRIAVKYVTSSAASEATTAVANDTDSQMRFGIRERTVDSTQQYISATTAEAMRDNLLDKLARPKIIMDALGGSGGGNVVEVEARGYTSTLNWRTYSSASGTTITQQTEISTILANTVHTASSVSYVPTWVNDPDLSLNVVRETSAKGAWARIQEILSLGSGTSPLVKAGCFGGNHFTAAPVDTSRIFYFVRMRGGRQEVTTPSGGPVEAGLVEPGVLALAVDAIPGRGLANPLLDDPRVFFVESVTYNQSGVRLHNARAQENTRALLRAALVKPVASVGNAPRPKPSGTSGTPSGMKGSGAQRPGTARR